MASIPSLLATLSPALSGRDAIAVALYRLILGLDTNDSELSDSAFNPTSTFAINGRVSKLDTTHFLTNIRITIADSGTKASATASALTQHYRGGTGLEPNQTRLLAGSLYYTDLVKDESSGL